MKREVHAVLAAGCTLRGEEKVSTRHRLRRRGTCEHLRFALSFSCTLRDTSCSSWQTGDRPHTHCAARDHVTEAVVTARGKR